MFQPHSTNARSRRVKAGAVMLTSVALLAIACSPSGANEAAGPKSTQAPFNENPPLELPTKGENQMIVPPAPGVPALAAPGAVGGNAASGAVLPNLPSIPLTPNISDGSGARTPGGGGVPQTPEGQGVTNEFIAKVTGAGSVSATDAKFGVSGAGSAVMWDNGSGKVLTAFGDTFGGARPAGQRSDQPPLISANGVNLPVLPELLKFPALPFLNLNIGNAEGAGAAGDTGTRGPVGFDWRSNTLAVSSNHDLENGLKLDSFVEDKPAHARQVLTSRKAEGSELTTIPTSGMSIGTRQFLSYSSVREWGKTSGSWVTNYSGIAYSDDNGTTWKKDRNLVWPNSNAGWAFQMTALARHDGWVYLYGTPEGRVGGVFVARVAEGQVLDKRAYEYWTAGGWTNDPAIPPSPMITGAAGEVSVQYNASVDRWLMMYTDVVNDGIVLRQSTRPVGPWTDPLVVLSAKDYPYIYSAHMHPWSSGNNLFFTVSQWSTYNVYLMHTNVTAMPQAPPRASSPGVNIPGIGGIPSVPLPELPVGPLPNVPLLPPAFAPGIPMGPDE